MAKYYTDGRRPPSRYVAKCPETGKYLHMGCTMLTNDRNRAWTGRAHQIEAMQQTFPLGAKMTIMEEDRHV